MIVMIVVNCFWKLIPLTNSVLSRNSVSGAVSPIASDWLGQNNPPPLFKHTTNMNTIDLASLNAAVWFQIYQIMMIMSMLERQRKTFQLYNLEH